MTQHKTSHWTKHPAHQSCQLVKTNKHMRVWVERFAQASQTLAA
jgi:hypothetical protein